VLGRPGTDRRGSTAQDGDVKSIDADLEEFLRGRARRDRDGLRSEKPQGSVSRTSRWSVQSPPFSTLDGIPGRGVSDPNAPPPPANWKAVT